MQIDTVEDLLKAVEAARVQQGLSERALSGKAGKSPGLFWWWKKNAGTTSFATALEYCKALGLKITIQ